MCVAEEVTDNGVLEPLGHVEVELSVLWEGVTGRRGDVGNDQHLCRLMGIYVPCTHMHTQEYRANVTS